MVGAGGAKVGAPTDVANFGRINPKSCTLLLFRCAFWGV